MNGEIPPPPPPPSTSVTAPPVPPPPPPTMAIPTCDVFPPGFREQLQQIAQCDDVGLQLIGQQYITRYRDLEGAPKPCDLTLADAVPVSKIGDLRDLEHTWEKYKERIWSQERGLLDNINPFMPMWYRKADGGKDTPWVSDSGTISEKARLRLSQAIAMASPSAQADSQATELIKLPPTANARFINDVVDGLIGMLPLVLWSLGYDSSKEAEWRFGPSAVLLAGLGLEAFQRVAAVVAEYDADWQHWASCPLDELAKDITDARSRCAYGAGIVRMDWVDLQSAMRGEDICEIDGTRRFAPRWYVLAMAAHFMRHVRVWRTSEGPQLFVAYRGRSGLFSVPDGGMNQALSSSTNRTLMRDVFDILRIPYSQAKRSKKKDDEDDHVDEWQLMAASRLMDAVVPARIPNAESPDKSVDFLIPKGIRMQMRVCFEAFRSGWSNNGLVIRDVAVVDKNSGDVQKSASIDGDEIMNYQWPLENIDHAARLQWQSCLPDRVYPCRASEILFAHIRNIEDFGFKDGLGALIDATITCDLFRSDLAGTAVGNILQIEYPLIFALPLGATLTETTGQGKTFMCRILGGCLCPAIDITIVNRSAGAPSNRSMMEQVHLYGTTIYDEYVRPASHEHVLSQANLQGLSTGGTVSPGRAHENSVGIKLRHPLLFTAKMAPDVPDLLNRMLPIFLDILTSKSKASSKELDNITNGQLATKMRLCHLLHCQEDKVVESIQHMELAEGCWRFNGHLTVARYYAHDPKNIDKYFEAARTHCDAQHRAAASSGLAEDIGAAERFDIEYFWNKLSDTTLRRIQVVTDRTELTIGQMSAQVINLICGDGDEMIAASVLREHRRTEKQAVHALNEMLRKQPLVRDGWTLHHVDKKNCFKPDNRYRARSHYHVECEEDPTTLIENILKEKGKVT
jgi:hypothetical protein